MKIRLLAHLRRLRELRAEIAEGERALANAAALQLDVLCTDTWDRSGDRVLGCGRRWTLTDNINQRNPRDMMERDRWTPQEISSLLGHQLCPNCGNTGDTLRVAVRAAATVKGEA